jgi:hypothetical protein
MRNRSRSNCIIFALTLWFRRARRGKRNNYLVIRMSRVPWGILHLMHGRHDSVTDQIRVVSYKPDADRKTGVELAFRGHVERGDKPRTENEG